MVNALACPNIGNKFKATAPVEVATVCHVKVPLAAASPTRSTTGNVTRYVSRRLNAESIDVPTLAAEMSLGRDPSNLLCEGFWTLASVVCGSSPQCGDYCPTSGH